MSDCEIASLDRSLELVSCLPPRHCLSRFLLRCPPPLSLAFIPELLAFSQREFNLYSTTLEIHPRRDQGQTLLLRLAHELADLLFMHQQLPGPQCRVIRIASVFVGADMAVQQPQFPILDEPIGILQIRPPAPNGLHFRA